MAITVNELTESVTEYATCQTSDAQLTAVSDITSLLNEVSGMISSSNVQAWQDALDAAPGLLDCNLFFLSPSQATNVTSKLLTPAQFKGVI